MTATIATFYSVGGGVGRTTLLLSVAYAIRKILDKKVAVIDLDLEAPTLYAYTKDPEETIRKLEHEARSAVELAFWLEKPDKNRDVFDLRVGDASIPALLQSPLAARTLGYKGIVALEDVQYQWSRVETVPARRRWLRQLAERFAEVEGADMILIDSRSGLGSIGVDALAAADIAVVPAPLDSISIERTVRVLIGIGTHLRDVTSNVWLKNIVIAAARHPPSECHAERMREELRIKIIGRLLSTGKGIEFGSPAALHPGPCIPFVEDMARVGAKPLGLVAEKCPKRWGGQGSQDQDSGGKGGDSMSAYCSALSKLATMIITRGRRETG